MSFLSGTVMDTLYLMPNSGSALASSTTQTVITGNTSTNPPYQLPAINSIWGPSYAAGRALRLVARGIFGTTGTPTLKLNMTFGTTQGTAGTTLASTGALTTASGVANGMWEMEFEVFIDSVGGTNNTPASSIWTAGIASFGVGNNAATTTASAYMIGSTSAITTVNPTTAYWLELYATWGTSSASNTITCTQFMVQALN